MDLARYLKLKQRPRRFFCRSFITALHQLLSHDAKTVYKVSIVGTPRDYKIPILDLVTRHLNVFAHIALAGKSANCSRVSIHSS